MSTATSTNQSTKQSIVDRIRARIEKRAAHQRLERELASYRTPAQRAELDAMIDRARPEQVEELRRIVNRQRMAA